ncbi:MAG: NADH:flavin oxidoreductase, partial [Verrucomicrobiota bacterium]
MTAPFKLTRVNSLKTPADFRAHCVSVGADIPLADALRTGADSPLLRPLKGVSINGRTPGNRIAIHPMEGWDGTTTGGVTDEMRRRWRRFGASGAKIVCGAEAMAVRPDGRANPNQLIITQENLAGIAELARILREEHAARWGTDADLVVGFQLTHSGRFCRPNDKKRWEPRVAFRHPVLDARFNVTSDAQVLTDDDVRALVSDYVRAARLAREA